MHKADHRDEDCLRIEETAFDHMEMCEKTPPKRSPFRAASTRSLGIGVQVGFRSITTTVMSNMRIPNVNQAGLSTGRWNQYITLEITPKYRRDSRRRGWLH